MMWFGVASIIVALGVLSFLVNHHKRPARPSATIVHLHINGEQADKIGKAITEIIDGARRNRGEFR